MRLAYLIFFLAACSARKNDKDVAGPKVTIPQGTLRGLRQKTHNGRDVAAFLGIPFAKPPVGQLRFAAPKPADCWTGILDATKDAPMCIQQEDSGAITGKEDCLYLNVFTPALKKKATKKLLPVMVYIFGGYFESGSVNSVIYNGYHLLDEDVLLVVPSYRLGILGLLSTNDDASSGNWVLKDLVLAFKWIRDNIEHFGGDPNRVTIFGDSSGAAIVHHLALSPLMDGLFHGYITQSGTALSPGACQSGEKAKSISLEIGQAVGCPTSDTRKLVKCLRNQDASTLVGLLIDVWIPTVEGNRKGAAIVQCPIDAVDTIRDLPWINGVVRDEGLTFFTCYFASRKYWPKDMAAFRQRLIDLLDHMFLPFQDEAYKRAIFDEYFGDETADMDTLAKNATILIGDIPLRYPAWKALQKQVALAENPTYFYTINHVGSYSFTNLDCKLPDVIGITHGDELFWLFDYFAAVDRTPTAADLDMSQKLCHMWATFAATGVPLTHRRTTIWEPYNAKDNNILRIGEDDSTKLVIQHTFHEARMKFWEKLNARFSRSRRSHDPGMD